MTQRVITRIMILSIIAGACVALAFEIALLIDLESYEWAPLWELIGLRGLLTIVALNVGLLALLSRLLHGLLGRPHPARRTSNVILAVTGLVALWVLQYMFLETPVTVRLALLTRGEAVAGQPNPADQDFSGFSLARRAAAASDRQRLQVMYSRVRVNNPDAYARHPIGATIDRYAERYGVDPSLLFFLTYIDSFYGEAVSGPVPFLRAMTSETIRDTVQVHLPAWFVESSPRRALVTGTTVNRLFGEALGFKLRYAVHKSTLDVSLQPYALNTYSDIFLVMQAYPGEFQDLLGAQPADPAAAALRESFLRLRDSALLRPYEQPYTPKPHVADWYDAHRADLERFSRAAFYVTLRNFDFATRVQALLSTYQRDYYRTRIGPQRWDALPDWQQVAMLAMIRDLYVPNVGHLAYNVYALPELNCTPLEYVANEAANSTAVNAAMDQLWRPTDYSKLWGGATYRLRVMNEIWELTHGKPIPGLGVEYTTEVARNVVWLTSRP